MATQQHPDRNAIIAGYARVAGELRGLLENTSASDLRRRSAGTKWTNEQLLFHMVFGFMIVAALRNLVRFVSLLPPVVGQTLAGALDAGTVPFDWINYQGSRYAALVFNHRRMGAKLERVLAALVRHLDAEQESTLARRMDFPARWDPFFHQHMSLLDVYEYPIHHFDFHRAQLSLRSAPGQEPDEPGPGDG